MSRNWNCTIGALEQSSVSPVEEKPSSETNYVVGTWPQSTPGHTGYLTVATLPPPYARSKSNKKTTKVENDEKNSENGDKMAVDEN
ncbi:unnamed protein product [Spodoptera exigua]|nr:unnamed protein product [Spodoptera exigua]